MNKTVITALYDTRYRQNIKKVSNTNNKIMWIKTWQCDTNKWGDDSRHGQTHSFTTHNHQPFITNRCSERATESFCILCFKRRKNWNMFLINA